MNTLELPLDLGELYDSEHTYLPQIGPRIIWNHAMPIADRLLLGRDLDYVDDIQLGPWERIEGWNITHVIDLREEDEIDDEPERLAERTRPIHYINIGTHDNGGPQEDEWFEQGLSAVMEAVHDPEAVIYIHCHMGVARAPSMCFAMMLAAGVDPVHALKVIRTRRPIAAISYAGYALDWWLRRQGASDEVRAEAYARVESWFEENPINLAWIIDEIHADGG